MNYLKLSNVMLGILKDAKYAPKGEKINWAGLGFSVAQIQALAIQYNTGGSLTQYLPISDDERFNLFVPLLQADVAALGIGTVEVVSEDREAWEAAAIAASDPDANLTEQEKRNKERDRLLSIATVTIRGVDVWISESEIDKMLKYEEQSQALLGVPVSWKGYNTSTGEVARVDLTNADILNLAKTLLVTGQSIHVESDTQMPTNPWPVPVIE